MAGGSHERPIAVYGALIANLGIAVAKFVAAAITGSAAMMSEGIHSVVDTGNQALLLVGIRRSRRPADDMHQFGHGKELYFWTLVVAIILFGIGGGLAFYEGIIHVVDPQPLENPLANYVVLAIAFVLEAGSWTIALRALRGQTGEGGIWRKVRSSKDPSVVTVLLEDSAALVGLMAAFVGILLADVTGDVRFDGLGSIVIGAVLTVVAFFLAYESRGLLVGERARTDVRNTIRRVVEFDDAVDSLVEARTMHMGPDDIVLAAKVRFKPTDAVEIVAAIDRVKASLADADNRLTDITIEPVVAD